MRLLSLLLVGSLFLMPVSALEIQAPAPPGDALERMPEETSSLETGLREVVINAVSGLHPDLQEAARVSLGILAAAVLMSVLDAASYGGKTAVLAGVVAVVSALLLSTDSLIRLATDTILEIGAYGKLLLPVMTAAMAAQGGFASSAALYTGTAFFSAILSTAISCVLIPLVYVYLALSIGNHALGEDLLKKLQDFAKWLITWFLKTILYVFTGYMGITGAITGGTDAATLKATKLTISGMVPVVGGILSDASESVLVGAGLMKNAAGVYGLLATLSICVGPFLKIGVQYLLLKVTAAICSVFDVKNSAKLVQDFSGTMGLLLGMTGSVCLLMLISTICFLKEVG